MRQAFDSSKDYFAVLGIHQRSDDVTIKRAYRKLARRYHPDVSKILNAKEKFQEIAEAYEILTKHREAYFKAFYRQQPNQNPGQQRQQAKPNYSRSKARSQYSQNPIDGKNREITYPLTLRYAIRLLKIGYFYVPGLKVRMKFTREAFSGKTFRIKGKGYQGLFGGKTGDYMVRFELKLDALKWELKGADIYGTVKVPRVLIEPGNQLELDSPAGSMKLVVPANYESTEYIKVRNMGLPGDAKHSPGHLFARLEAA